MSKILTIDEVNNLAQLSRLRFSEDEVERYREEINSVLKYFELLESVDTDGLEPTLQVTGLRNIVRVDQVKKQLASPENLMALAPRTESGFIKVRRMI